MAQEKWTKKELAKLSDDELTQYGSDMGIPIEDIADRKGLEKEMLGKPKPKKRPAEPKGKGPIGSKDLPAAALKGGAKKKAVNKVGSKTTEPSKSKGAPGDTITLQYVGKGTAQIGGRTWRNGMGLQMTRKAAQAIAGRLPARFAIKG